MKLFYALSVIAVLAVAGCSQGGTGGGNGTSGNAGLKDCGNDLNCFTTSLQACASAKLLYVGVVEYEQAPDFGTTDTTLFEIRGGTPDACKVYRKFVDYEIKGVSPLESIYAETKGKDLICTINVSEIATVGLISLVAPSNPNCSGSFVDWYKSKF